MGPELPAQWCGEMPGPPAVGPPVSTPAAEPWHPELVQVHVRMGRVRAHWRAGGCWQEGGHSGAWDLPSYSLLQLPHHAPADRDLPCTLGVPGERMSAHRQTPVLPSRP